MNDFVNGDIVVFKADAAKRVFRVLYSEEENRVRISYALKDEPNTASSTELSYPHLLTLAEPLMQFFRFGHLQSQELQDRSRPFWELASKLVIEYPRNPERTVALRKLLEAKDAAVRSTLYQG